MANIRKAATAPIRPTDVTTCRVSSSLRQNGEKSELAIAAGISRATLYKYFADVTAAIAAWHERQVEQHLAQLETARALAPDPMTALRNVLTLYSTLQTNGHGSGAPAFLHHSSNMATAHHRLLHLVRECIAAAAAAGGVRTDYSAVELTQFCLKAAAGDGHVNDPRRFIDLIVDSLSAGKTGLGRQ
ncbi:TetR/AcrR family transcriptional regulator [Devosia sp.]|uniref:TetR/AcrR family transcriptional regulator n=1 Tax=Devosia sp. TaxID=1871048 RepID=UPI003263886B